MMNKLLTIDDEYEFTEMIKSYFEPRGFIVLTAHDGESGLELAQKEHPNVALIDLKMPGKHGDEVLKEMKNVSPATKCIMITASQGQQQLRERLLGLGANACFDKPITSLKDLENKVKEFLS